MNVAADYLSGGEQQMVALARALSSNVKLLLLDKPFEGLAPAVVLELFSVFDRLRRHASIVIGYRKKVLWLWPDTLAC